MTKNNAALAISGIRRVLSIFMFVQIHPMDLGTSVNRVLWNTEITGREKIEKYS
jgi:hypothetical protein